MSVLPMAPTAIRPMAILSSKGPPRSSVATEMAAPGVAVVASDAVAIEEQIASSSGSSEPRTTAVRASPSLSAPSPATTMGTAEPKRRVLRKMGACSEVRVRVSVRVRVRVRIRVRVSVCVSVQCIYRICGGICVCARARAAMAGR